MERMGGFVPWIPSGSKGARRLDYEGGASRLRGANRRRSSAGNTNLRYPLGTLLDLELLPAPHDEGSRDEIV